MRLWLILTVVAIVGVMAIAEVGISSTIYAWQQRADRAELASVRHIVGADPARWRDAGWQRQAAASLAALSVDMQLFAGRRGDLVFTTAGARAFLDTSVLARGPVVAGAHAARPGGQPGLVTLTGLYNGAPSPGIPVFQRMIIPGPARGERTRDR